MNNTYCLLVYLVPGNKPYFSNPAFAQKAAAILGTTEENLARVLFSSTIQLVRSRSGSNVSRSGSNASRSGSKSSVLLSPAKSGDSTNVLSPSVSSSSIDSSYDLALNALEGFVAGLYVEAFTALVRLINRSINTASKVSSVMNVFDAPGFQNTSSIGKYASFEDLCSNYCCEKMQWLKHFCTFTLSMDRYNRVSMSPIDRYNKVSMSSR